MSKSNANARNKSSKPRNKQANASKGNNGRTDQLPVKGDLNSTNFKNNPNWYFKDAEQAEQMSRIQMNAFGGFTPIENSVPATIMSFYMNPCPGVTPNVSTNPKLDENWKNNGINRAAQKLWYILTAKSGRAAGYTKADCALLILAVGAMISVYEFLRRAFAISYVYGNRNRTMPTLLWKAMGIDPDDFRSNAANYLKRVNSMMAIMNQLPIPGNIAWFAKCQDIFQNIYMDYPSDMAQIFIFCPSTTWAIEEDDGFIGGSYLKTIDMCVKHNGYGTGGPNQGPVVGFNTLGNQLHDKDSVCTNREGTNILRTFDEYIDVFEYQLNKLLFSSSFSQIYSDILRAFETGSLTQWHFDYIDEKYQIVPIYDESRNWMIHNMTMPFGMVSKTRDFFHNNWVAQVDGFTQSFKYGTPLNDVYQWAFIDSVIYNPTLHCLNRPVGGGGIAVYRQFSVLDFPNSNPSTEERIEFTRYSFLPCKYETHHEGLVHKVDLYTQTNTHDNVAPIACYSQELPDFWTEIAEIWNGLNDAPHPMCDDAFQTSVALADMYQTAGQITRMATMSDLTKFHHGPNVEVVDYVPDLGGYGTSDMFGELTSWTKVLPSWYSSLNQMVYVDLFDIR